ARAAVTCIRIRVDARVVAVRLTGAAHDGGAVGAREAGVAGALTGRAHTIARAGTVARTAVDGHADALAAHLSGLARVAADAAVGGVGHHVGQRHVADVDRGVEHLNLARARDDRAHALDEDVVGALGHAIELERSARA